MRVTSNSFPKALVGQLNQLTTRQNRLQNQAATGQRLHLPQDDPAAMRRVLDLQTETRQLSQYKKNIDFLKEQATAAYEVTQGLKRISDRAGEIATLADGTKSPQQLRIYATEITQLIRQGVQVINGRHRGEYLFGGTRSNQAPFALASDADGRVTAVTYQGNTDVAAAEIDNGTTLSIRVPGANNTGSGPRGLITDSRAGADFFNHLIAVQNDLLAGNAAAVAATDRPALMRDEENLIFHIGNYGAVQARLEVTASTAASRGTSLDGLISKEADADLAETLVRLNETQTAYQAALQSGASILGRSLLDYLR